MPTAAERHRDLDTWLHTQPPVPNIPGARGHPHRGHHHHHPVGGLFVGLLMLAAWLILLELWALEVAAWATAWMLIGCRWIYRHNVIGTAAARLVRPRAARTPYDPHGAPQRPVDLAALAATDPYRLPPLPAALAADLYDTERSRTRS